MFVSDSAVCGAEEAEKENREGRGTRPTRAAMKSAAQGLKAGNPALYCNPDSTDVEAGPGALPTAEDEPVKAAPSASTAAAKAPAPKLDASTFDIVKATQYGARERVEELVEGGFDVNQRDEENVTLLHWAAINNREVQFTRNRIGGIEFE